jgi:hypothetical protein
MKTPGVFIASIASAFALTGCNFNAESDDLVDPGTDSPPLCSVVGLTLQSAMVTSTRGGYADLSLTISNSPECATAFNVHADVIAEQSNQWFGEASVDFDALNGGTSTVTVVEVPVTVVPDEAYCTLSWRDDAGNSYSSIVKSDLYGGLYLTTPTKGVALKIH